MHLRWAEIKEKEENLWLKRLILIGFFVENGIVFVCVYVFVYVYFCFGFVCVQT